MKRFLSIAVIFILLVSTVAGCAAKPVETTAAVTASSQGNDTSSANTASPIGVSDYTGEDIYLINDGESVEIRFVIPGGSAAKQWPLYEEAAAAFSKDYPNVKVTMDGSGDTATWRQNAIVEYAGTNPPNISWCVPSYAKQFIADSLIIDWKEVYSNPRYAYFSDFIDMKVLEGVADSEGRLPFIPHEGTIGQIFYNKAIFAEHGWTIPKTFEELLKLSDDMNAAGVVPFITGGADFRYAWLITQIMIRTGGTENTKALATGAFDQWANPDYGFPQAIDAVQQLIDHKFFHPGVNGISQVVDEPAMFTKGEAAMSYEGPWKIGFYSNSSTPEWVDENVGVFSFPEIGSQGDAGIVGGSTAGYVITTKQSDVQIEACLEFTKYIMSRTWMKQDIELGAGIPAGTIEYDKSVVPTPMVDMYTAYLEADKSIPPMDGLTSNPQIDMVLKKEIIPMMIAGDMTAEEAVKYMDETAKSLME